MSSSEITDFPTTDRESQRLAALARYDILDTPDEPSFDRIANLVQLIFGVQTSAVSLIDAHRQWLKASRGLNDAEFPLRDTICNSTIATDQPLVVADLSMDERFKDNPFVLGEAAIRFYAGVPIRTSDGHNIGTICAIDQKPRLFTAREIEILGELARIVMDEIELRQLASVDGLTGLRNRRAFKDDAQRFVALARRHRSSLSVISFDIDHFKSVNDTYGHAAGDMVLNAVAQLAQDTPRQSDLAGRMGGEEFVLLLPGADIISASAVAERLRHRVVDLSFPGSQPPIRVSASFGVATLDPGRDDLDSLLVKADEALYEAKRGGRNRVETWTGTTLATARTVERRRVLKAGRLVFNQRRSTRDCTIRSIWDTGAEIQLSDTADLPETVTLEMRSSGMSWDGIVTQRRPTSIELSFEPASASES